jgi:hypothetical protein
LDPPADLVAVFGPPPEDRKDRAAWLAAIGRVDGYRRGYGIEQSRLAKHEGRKEREEPAGAAPAENREERQGQPTSDPVQRQGQAARHDRRVRPDDRVAELLGPQPTEDLRQRRAWQVARTTIERFRERTHGRYDLEREAG